MSPFYTNEKENYWKNKMNEMEEIEYFEFEMMKNKNLKLVLISLLNKVMERAICLIILVF